MLAWSTDNVTEGKASSSVIVTCCCVPNSSPLVTFAIWTTTVSSISTRLSDTAVTVITPLVSPGAMTI